MKKPSLLLALSLSLASACGAPPTTSDDPESALDVTLAGDAPEANAIVELLNDEGTTFELLDATVGLDSRAAENLIDARPFDSIASVDAVPYVGPAAIEKLTAYLARQEWLSYTGGSWEGVAMNGAQVALALDLVGNAGFQELDVDVGLDSRAAENILAARPITSMNQLAAISYVGEAALKKIRTYLPQWQENGTSLEIYDGVAFTHLEAAHALAAANDANLDALSSVEIFGAQANLIVGRRPWPSMKELADYSGIGPLTISRLKTLGEAYAGIGAFVVTQADVEEFREVANDITREDDEWDAQISALLATGDLSNDAAWVASTLEKIRTGIETRVASFASAEVGRTYSSRDAAREAFLSYVRGLKETAKDEYPKGALVFAPALTGSARLARGKVGMLAYWPTFVGSPEWVNAFEDRTWSQVKSQVLADVSAFETTDAYEVYEQTDLTIFAGRTYQLYTEVHVDALGKVTRVYIEID